MSAPDQSARSALEALLLELADAFAQEGRSGGALTSSVLRAADASGYRALPAGADPGGTLTQAATAPSALPMAAHVLAARDLISWSYWGAEKLEREVARGLYSTELVGPDGHIGAEDVRVGLLVSDAGIDYPVSSHSGEETYFVISGTAGWVVGDTPYTPKAPGSFVHHPAWVPHGRRTGSEPFLGAWRWSGNLDLTSFRVEGQEST